MSVVPFEFQNNAVRTVVSESGEVLFVGKDVAAALGYANHNDTMNKHCRGVAKRYPIVDSLGRAQEVRVLTEADVMRLIISSKLPAAVEFERWVFEEVLPAIRKTGSYSVPKVEPVRMPTPIDTEQQMLALKRVMLDGELKAAAPLVWQHLSDAVQNQALAFLGVTQLPLLEESGVVHPLDVTELAKRAGLSIPSNYRGTCGKYVADRCSPVKIERVVNGAVRVCNAYTDHAAATAAIREFFGKIEA